MATAQEIAKQIAGRVLSQDHPGDARDPLDAPSGATVSDVEDAIFYITTNDGEVFKVVVTREGHYETTLVPDEHTQE